MLIILLSCAGTAVAMALSSHDKASDVVGAVDKHIAAPQAESGEQSERDIHFDLSKIKRAMPENTRTAALFQSKSWNSPPPSIPIQNLPPPKPMAPSLPFIFIGKMIDGNEVVLFLSKNGQEYTVKANDVMDGAYRVDKIAEDNATLTYLPMNVQQILTFNSRSAGNPASGATTPAISSPTFQPLNQADLTPR